MNDYQRDMIHQRHQQDIHNAQQWRQTLTTDTNPAPHITNKARQSLLVRFIAATVQRIRRVLTANRQSVSHSIETPVEFR
jgi:urease accessory protein UreH